MTATAPALLVGRRLRFRDLEVFFAVVRLGSMAKAAQHLGLTQPAVSDIVSALEEMFGVRLFDRSSRGVAPTIYGNALLKRGRGAFDELNQGIRDIEFLSDPTAGFLRIGFPASVLGGLLSLALERFTRRYPRATLQFDEVTSPGNDFPTLRNREHDLIVARIARPLVDENDLEVEILFQDPLVITADARSKWGRRRKIDAAELIDASWILTEPNASVYLSVAEAFQSRGLPMPRVDVAVLSGLLRMHLLCRGPFVTAVPNSLLRHTERLSLKVLPVNLHIRGYPVAILTLKNRVLNPLARFFIEHVREVSKTMTPSARPDPR